MGFADPPALGFGILAGVLVLLHFWERRRRQVVVPALLLWHSLREDTIRTERFRPDLLFLLQMLALLSLIAGLAKPYWHGAADETAPARFIFVMDTTASMQARAGHGSRWRLALDSALRDLATLPDNSEIMLVGAGDTPETIVPFTRNREDVQQALTRLGPADTGGDLAVALASVESARRRNDSSAQVRVYSDRPVTELPGTVRDTIDFHHVGEPADNVAIESLIVRQGRFQPPEHATVDVRIHNYGLREQHGMLSLEITGQTLLQTGFTLLPRQSEAYRVDHLPGSGQVIARLNVDDALTADNTAYGWVRPVHPVRVLLVSPSDTLAKDLFAVANVTPGLEILTVKPGAVDPPPPADLVIFDRMVPPTQPTINALFLYPPPGNAFFPASGDATEVDVLDWNTRHPVLQSLQFVTTRPFERTRILAAAPGVQPLLWSRNSRQEFPVAVAREENGHRSVCYGFDLAAERLLSNDNVGLFLFFLNTLAWLAPPQDDSAVVFTGQTYVVRDTVADTIQVLDPSGATRRIEGAPPALTPRHAGVYRLEVDGTERLLLAGFVNAAESDLATVPAGPAASPPPVSMTPNVLARSHTQLPTFSRTLCVAAFVLLLLEWIVAARRA